MTTQDATLVVAEPPTAQDKSGRRSTKQGTWSRFRRQRIPMIALCFLIVMVVVALLADVIAPYAVDEMTPDFMHSFSKYYFLGTDNNGFDVFSRLLVGMRTSLLACLLAVALGLLGGAVIGLASGYLGGIVDNVFMRVVDAFMALPGLLMAMAVVAILGQGVFNAMIGLSFAFMPGFARLIRGQVLAVREEAFVDAARVVGARPPRIILRHIIPNIASPLIVQVLMSMGFALLAEGALAYIGLTVKPPQPSLGSMLQLGFQFINNTPRLILVPGIVIVLLSASFNAVADGLRDALVKQDRMVITAEPTR